MNLTKLLIMYLNIKLYRPIEENFYSADKFQGNVQGLKDYYLTLNKSYLKGVRR